jgi:hypothetical protein
VDFISQIVDRVVDFTGPYVAVALLAVIIILVIYRLMGRA